MMAWLSSLDQGAQASGEQGLAAGLTDGAQGWSATGLQPTEDLGGAMSNAAGASTAELQEQLTMGGMLAPSGMVAEEQEMSLELRPGRVESAGTLSPEMLRGQASAPAHGARASESLPTPVNHPQFQQAFSERVGLWVKGLGEGESLNAELHLNPASMGSISVKIALDGRMAQVDFAAATQETRRAIEDSLPMLSAALDEVGIKLGGSAVSDQSAQSASERSQEAAGRGSSRATGEADEDQGGARELTVATPARSGLNGRLDLYA